MDGPLEGVKVLDLTQIMAGPFCTLLLADMGADVVKVEKPDGGDDNRRQGPPFIKGTAAAFYAINRNKRSMVLDLKNEQGREVFRRLVPRFDIVVENFRPGTLEKLGLGYDQLKELSPALIYCSISGYGRTGPLAEQGGFDLVAQGMAGLMSITGISGAPPVKVGVPISDLNAGLYGAFGILCAHIHRLRTGKGQLVDTSLFEGALSYTFWHSALYFATGQVPGPLGSAHLLVAPYQALKTKDGYINLGAGNQRTWEAFCHAVRREDLLKDPRFKDTGTRKLHEKELAEILEQVLETNTTEYWLEVCAKAGVPAGPINNLAQAFAHPQTLARQMVVELESHELGSMKHLGVPVKLSETPGSVRTLAPALGQHTEDVLLENGFTKEEVLLLNEQGITKKAKG